MTPAFWESFWANFWSSVVVLILASVIVPFALRFREMASLRFRTYRGEKNKLTFHKTEAGNWEIELNLEIINRGNHTLDRYYWEIFIPENIGHTLSIAHTYSDHIPMRNEKWLTFKRVIGYMDAPLFPYDTVPFQYRLLLSAKTHRPIRVYYLFRTERGMSPFYAWLATHFGWPGLLHKIDIT